MIRFRLERPGARLPHRAFPSDVGLDFAVPSNILLLPQSTKVVDFGVSFVVNFNCQMLMMGRSGLSMLGLEVIPGIISQNYTNTLAAVLKNNSAGPMQLSAGMRVAQLVIVPVCSFVVGPPLVGPPQVSHASGGRWKRRFGSSGVYGLG